MWDFCQSCYYGTETVRFWGDQAFISLLHDRATFAYETCLRPSIC